MSAPDGWAALVAEMTPHVTPEWTKHATEHADQSWVRLVLLVDAHFQLSQPRITEKVAMTMADLAVDRDSEREGWEALRQAAYEGRVDLVSRLVDATTEVLPENLIPLFERSIAPAPPGMAPPGM
ncbi:MAG: hypothetical protein AB7V42_11995 [Thermoleophilia bacterium]